MSVIRVGLVLGQVGWIGGVNYFHNLLFAINSDSDTIIYPVVFVGLKSDISQYEGLAEIIRTPILDRKSNHWWLNKIFEIIFFRKNILLFFLLKKHQINLVSHIGILWKNCSIKTIGWIPDFQQMHLPDLFEKKELRAQNKQHENIIKHCNALLLSSEDSLNDLYKFSIKNTTPTYILRFVSCLHALLPLQENKKEIINRYSLDRPWFHLPNQFWAHKNHVVVIEALNILKKQGKNPLVICTGKTSDHRNITYFKSLTLLVKKYGLENNFIILGVVPYADLLSIMKYSVATINPSIFEGWSTSVEESKSLGKKIILSDIKVHIEQSPIRGIYFNPNNHLHLAELINSTLNEFNVENELFLYENARKESKKNIISFVKQFESICLEVLNI